MDGMNESDGMSEREKAICKRIIDAMKDHRYVQRVMAECFTQQHEKPVLLLRVPSKRAEA
jgi:hypothetical protein